MFLKVTKFADGVNFTENCEIFYKLFLCEILASCMWMCGIGFSYCTSIPYPLKQAVGWEDDIESGSESGTRV